MAVFPSLGRLENCLIYKGENSDLFKFLIAEGKSTPTFELLLKLGSHLPTINIELSRNSGVSISQSCGIVPNTVH